MKTGIFEHYLTKNGLTPSDVKINYGFSSGSGDFVLNEIYPSLDSHIDLSGLAVKGTYPGLSIGKTNSPVSNLGSGFFDGQELLRVGYEVPYEKWCFFLNFGNENCSINKFPDNTSQILFSSMTSPSSVSGFGLGINDYNKLFVEYNDESHKYIRTFDKELGRFNLVSLSFYKITGATYNIQNFSLTHHDVASDIHSNFSFDVTQNYKDSKEWHVGGMPNLSQGYTGYSGYVNDFILFDKQFGNSISNSLSSAFFITGITPSSFEAFTYTEPLLSGIRINSTGVIGSEITGTGYSAASSVSQLDGSDIKFVTSELLSGAITGSLIEYIFDGTKTLTGYRPVSEQIHYDPSLIEKYVKEYVLFTDTDLENSVYEINSYKNKKFNLNIRPDYEYGYNDFTYEEDYAGNNINLFLNGMAQLYGTDYSSKASKVIVSSGSFDVETDVLLYDDIAGSSSYLEFAGNTSTHVVDDGSLVDKDIFLNGQKLLTGLDYTTAGTQISIFPEKDSGVLMFLPRDTDTSYLHTGSYPQKVATKSSNDQIWINGVIQIKGINYQKTTDCTVVDKSKNLTKYSNLLYNNNESFINI